MAIDIQALIKTGESETVELKQSTGEMQEIFETVGAFANNHILSSSELTRLFFESWEVSWDAGPVSEATTADLQEENIRRFLRQAQRERNMIIDVDAPLNEVLEKLELLYQEKLSRAAVLLFGKRPQKFPNPFNPATTIRYGLPRHSRVTLKVFDALGKEVVTLLSEAPRAAGYHVAIWDGRNQFGAPAPSGLFFYQLQAGGWVLTKKMILLK